MVSQAPRTSQTHPLRIDSVGVASGGMIGITLCPGKQTDSQFGPPWRRDLAADLAVIQSWGPTAVVTLVEQTELVALNVIGIETGVIERGMRWFHAPIADVTAPGAYFEKKWEVIGPELHRALRASERVLVHCRGGLGRAGTVAARLLVELGVEPREAIERVRGARRGAIETSAQERHVLACSPADEPAALRLRSTSRFRGCLLGGAVGDALGAPVEFDSRSSIEKRFGPLGIRDMAPAYGRVGAITDDTQMTLFTAEGCLRAWRRQRDHGLCSERGVIRSAYGRWLQTQGYDATEDVGDDGWLYTVGALHSQRAPGNTCISALRSQSGKNDSKGCGGVMRVAPIGLWGSASTSDEDVFNLATEAAAITHGHPSGQLSAGFLAVVISALARGRALQFAIADAMAPLTARRGHEEVLAAVRKARTLASAGPGTAEAVEELGTGWTGEEALAIALYCALATDSFEDAVILAVNHGGDSDSTGSIAGQIMGTWHGKAAIPQRWLAPLELSATLETIADDLVAIVADWQPGPQIRRRYPGN